MHGVLSVVDGIFTGIIGVVSLIVRVPALALATGLNGLVSGIANVGLEDIEKDDLFDIFITPFDIFFNKIPILDVNFFEFEGVSDTVESFRVGVAGWYYTLRLIAMMALLVILMYIGIRMAISTIAQEKAMYKKMLVDWVTSLALLFLLHYIILFTFECNNALVKAIETVVNNSGDSFNLSRFYGALAGQAINPLEVVAGFTALILYFLFIGVTFKFIFVYIKRMLTIGFLIMIAPLITITYSIDKIGDQKAQALNTWLKEFVFNVLIQPFHCIIFAAFASVAMKVIGVGELTWGDISIGGAVLAFACITFIDDGEKIVKNIFGFGKASSLGQLAEGAAAAMVALKYSGQAGAAIGSGVAKGKNFISNNKGQLKTLTNRLPKNLPLTKVGKNGNLTRRGERIARKKASEKYKNGEATSEKAAYEDIANKWKTNKQARHEIGQSVGKAVDGATKAVLTTAGKPIKAISKKMDDAQKKKDNKLKAKFDQTEGAKALKNSGNIEEYNKAFAAYKENEKYSKKMGMDVNDPDFENQKKAYQKMENDKKKVISDYAGSAHKYLKSKRKTILSTSSGVLTGLIGMGAAGTTGFAAASKFGSGIINGYMSNTNGTLQAQMQALSQSMQSLNPNVDFSTLAYKLNENNENKAYKDIAGKLNELLNKISALTQADRNRFDGEISKKIAMDQPITSEFLDSMLDKYGVTDPEQRETTKSQMVDFASKKIEVALASKIATSVAAGRSLEEITENITNVTNVTNNNNTIINNSEEHYNEESSSERDISSVNPPAAKNYDRVIEGLQKDSERAQQQSKQALDAIQGMSKGQQKK